MIRKTVTIFSLIGLLLSLGLWGVSYWCVGYTSRSNLNSVVDVEDGWLLCCGGVGRTSRIVQRYLPNTAGFKAYGFDGFDTDWLPSLPIFGSSRLDLPLWIPTIFFAGMLVFVRTRHHSRRKLGLCVKCGYDLRGSGERCPECGTTLASSDVLQE